MPEFAVTLTATVQGPVYGPELPQLHVLTWLVEAGPFADVTANGWVEFEVCPQHASPEECEHVGAGESWSLYRFQPVSGSLA